jgi:hypothetical protein
VLQIHEQVAGLLGEQVAEAEGVAAEGFEAAVDASVGPLDARWVK